ncbi:MAG: hypothetical protein AAGI08_10785 [Bacteroidota bacterium]
MNRLFLLVLFLFTVAGCDLFGSDPVRLRIENASSLDFDSVSVGFTSDDVEYGAIEAGQTSGYREFDTAYRYGGVTVEAAGQRYDIVPFDFVGERPLEAGEYTFVLTVVGPDLRLEFRED